jgi:hypothetical protein
MADNMDYNQGIDTTSLLLARGFGGYGGGYGNGLSGGGGYSGGGYLTAEAHANGTATKEAIDCNSAQFLSGLDRVSDQNKETRDNFRFDQLSQSINNQEFRSLDRQRDIERLMTDNAKDSAKCCCDAKLLASQNACDTQKLVSAEANATRELILAVEGRSNIRLLDAANAKITQLETINALSGHHRP